MNRTFLLPFALLPALLAALWLALTGDAGRDRAASVDRSVVRILLEGPIGRGSGSGFVVNTDGIVATNFHVVARSQTSGWSLAVAGREGTALPAEIVATFPGEDWRSSAYPGWSARP